MFKGFWGKGGLKEEYEKRQYGDKGNIEGLKAQIDSETYSHFLECLPPLRWEHNSFYLSEFLSGDLTLFFWSEEQQGKTLYFCEVKKLLLNKGEWK